MSIAVAAKSELNNIRGWWRHKDLEPFFWLLICLSTKSCITKCLTVKVIQRSRGPKAYLNLIIRFVNDPSVQSPSLMSRIIFIWKNINLFHKEKSYQKIKRLVFASLIDLPTFRNPKKLKKSSGWETINIFRNSYFNINM